MYFSFDCGWYSVHFDIAGEGWLIRWGVFAGNGKNPLRLISQNSRIESSKRLKFNAPEFTDPKL